MGKTLATLKALDNMQADTALVVGTRYIVENTWPAEIRKWGFEWDYGIATRSKARIQAAWDEPMVLVNYENLAWFLDNCPHTFEVIVFDELSKMKAPGTKRFKKFQNKRKRFTRIWGLTGSPTANHLLHIWAQVRCLTTEPVLERTFSKFKSRNFYSVDRDAHIWIPYDDTEDIIFEAVAPLVDRAKETRTDTYRLNDIPIELPAAARAAESILMDTRVWGEVVAPNGGVLAGKLIQVASGAVYDSNDVVVPVHEEKIERAVELVDELQGQPLVIFYNYKHELDRLRKALPEAVWKLDVDRWNRGDIEVMLLHPASAGHGLNLQYGGHHILFFSLPWSLEHYEQSIGRVDRQGQKNQVTVHRLLAGYDYKVARSLDAKNVTQQSLLEALNDYQSDLDLDARR